MSDAKTRKLQYLLVKQLMESGTVELTLPDGIILEIGILQKDRFGELKKADDYCYVVASRGERTTILDSYNLGLQYKQDDSTIIYEDALIDDKGRLMQTLDII